MSHNYECSAVIMLGARTGERCGKLGMFKCPNCGLRCGQHVAVSTFCRRCGEKVSRPIVRAEKEE